MLAADHIQHLTNEGFTDEQIKILLNFGVRTTEEAEAFKLGYKIWGPDGKPRSCRGILFPFTNGFGQIRCDSPLERKDGGKPAKYITPVGATSKVFTPDGCKVITEGFKDAMAGTLHGGLATGAIAGVSHYRKALSEGSRYTILFDADGWGNSQVFSHLVKAGLYLKGKIQLLPEIKGEPKAGLCEYFKAGYTAKDYQELIGSALSPKEILLRWPEHWMTLDSVSLGECVKAAISLATLCLTNIEKEMFVGEVSKRSGCSISVVRKELLAAEKQQKTEAKKEEISKQTQSLIRVPDEIPVEQFVYETLFEAGRGDWGVFFDAFHRYQETKGYWKACSDQEISCIISHKLRNLYIEKGSKERKTVKKQGTFNNLRATLGYCRSALTKVIEEKNKTLIAFRQGTVDTRTGQMQPHDRTNCLTWFVDADYHPELECPPEFKKFLELSYGEDLIELIRVCLSMLLDPSAPYGRFIHLMGPSGSGKGTLLALIKEIFGESYRGASSLEDLNYPDKRHQFLTGCTVYVTGDVSGHITGLSGFLDLVDDLPLAGRALNSSSSYDKCFGVRFVVGSVSHLQIDNAGEGWDRRVIVVPTKPRRGSPDLRLRHKISAEKAQIISWVLAVDRDFRDNVLANPAKYFPKVGHEIIEAKLASDSVRRWLDDCLRPATEAQLKAEGYPLHYTNEELHGMYHAYCCAMRGQPKAMNKFIGHLASVIPLHRTQRGKRYPNSKKKMPRIWTNLYILPGVFRETTDTEDFATGTPSYVFNRHRKEPGGLEEFEAFQTSGGTNNWRDFIQQFEEGTIFDNDEVDVQNESLQIIEKEDSDITGSMVNNLGHATTYTSVDSGEYVEF